MATTTELTAEPSAFVRTAMRPMTKVINPLVRRLAGRRHFNQAAQLLHTGRRSGHVHITPVSARPSGDYVFIALTFGTGSDWCRNVLAGGGCTVRWRGREYALAHPVVVERGPALAAAGAAFKRRERAMMRAIGITHFLRMDIAAHLEAA
jgi:deazaflavin-dependent oxidoreductase (nitroreductase family)